MTYVTVLRTSLHLLLNFPLKALLQSKNTFLLIYVKVYDLLSKYKGQGVPVLN